jgi:hypothetical protein
VADALNDCHICHHRPGHSELCSRCGPQCELCRFAAAVRYQALVEAVEFVGRVDRHSLRADGISGAAELLQRFADGETLDDIFQ